MVTTIKSQVLFLYSVASLRCVPLCKTLIGYKRSSLCFVSLRVPRRRDARPSVRRGVARFGAAGGAVYMYMCECGCECEGGGRVSARSAQGVVVVVVRVGGRRGESARALGPRHLHGGLVEDKRLVADAALLGAARVLAHLDARVQDGLPGHDVFPAADQLAPVAGLGGLCEVALAEDLHAVVGDALGFFRVVEQVLHGGGEVGEVALDFDKILIGAVAAEEVVVVLDPLQLVRDNDGAAELAVFEGARVAASYVMLALVWTGSSGHTLGVCNKHVVALVDGPEKLLLEVWIRPPQLPDVAPGFPLCGVKQSSPQLGRKGNLAAPHELLRLLVPRLDALALDSFVGDFVQGANGRHVPAPEAKVGDQPEVVVLGAASERPHRLGWLGGQVLNGEDKFDVGHV